VEHHQEQGEEGSHDGRDAEDEKARHQEIEVEVRQRLNGGAHTTLWMLPKKNL
jgi:hypothetical protein